MNFDSQLDGVGNQFAYRYYKAPILINDPLMPTEKWLNEFIFKQFPEYWKPVRFWRGDVYCYPDIA